jgi:hypothetical protein
LALSLPLPDTSLKDFSYKNLPSGEFSTFIGIDELFFTGLKNEDIDCCFGLGLFFKQSSKTF